MCSQNVRPVGLETRNRDESGEFRSYYIGAPAMGPVGGYIKDTVIVCGGKNTRGNVESCFEFDSNDNRWRQIGNMAQKRFRATSVLDERGDLWVMGGSRGDSTIQADDKWVH